MSGCTLAAAHERLHKRRTRILTLFLHIGLHKTGTSWLQEVVVPYAGNRLRPVGDRAGWRRDFVVPHPYHFDAAAVRAHYAPLVAQVEAEGAIPIISDERLSGNPLSGGYDTALVVDRLAEVFPGARVLLVVREQRDMLRSIYDQYVRTGGSCSLRDFLAPPTRHVTPWFRSEYLMFDRVIAHLHARFGAANLLVLAHEQLVADPAGFQRALLTFAGNPDAALAPASERVNAGRTPAHLEIERRLNPFVVRDDSNAYSALVMPRISWTLRRMGAAFASLATAALNRRLYCAMQAGIADYCAGRFEASNRTTMELTGLDLAALGYAT